MRLSNFITDNLEPILDEWQQYAEQIPAARGMDKDELRDHAELMLETIVMDLDTPQSEEERKQKSRGHGRQKGHAARAESGAEKHAAARTLAGFGIEDLISEFRALRASVLRLWAQHSTSVNPSDLEDMTRFNEAIDQAVAESVTRHAAMVAQAQDVFLGILGHDLRNPLGAISMSAQFLLQSAALDGPYIKAAATIYNSSKQMGYLIHDLLDFTRARLGQGMPIAPEPANLGDIARLTVAQASAFHPETAITLDAAGDLGGEWDPARIGQVFSNLVGNAIKHGRPNGPVHLALSADAAHVTATVHNIGDPIPEEDLARIFEPLRGSAAGEQQEAGLGLGLYITREIVHAHAGDVTVVSSASDGTTFTVTLPRRRPRGMSAHRTAGRTDRAPGAGAPSA
jgi:signal transduction histidine kinase